MISSVEDWKEVRDRWTCDFGNVLDALKMAINEKVSKTTKNQIELAMEIVSEHQKVMLEIIQTLERMDRKLHGIDVATEGPNADKELQDGRR